MRRLLALLILVLAAGCSRRDRANPLDTGNPQTGGGPTGFNAIADFSLIRLAWDPQPGLGIDGFQLQRLAPGDSVYRPLGSLLPTSNSHFTDSGVNNGVRYRYRLYYVIAGALGTKPASDEATAGPARIWVSDPGWPGLLRLSPDGRDVAQVISTGPPNGLAFDPFTQYVWYSNLASGQVGLYDPQFVASQTFAGFKEAREIAIDPVNDSAWITDRQAGDVRHLFPTGSVATPGVVPLLDDPTGIAVDPADRSVWICEQAGNRVRHLAADGTAIATVDLSGPWRVAVDSLTHIAWVTQFDRGLVTLLAPNGQRLDSIAVGSGPIGLAIDRDHGRVWVTDAPGGRVVVIRLDTRNVEFVVSGLPGARDVAVDRTTGEAWVVASSARSVVRLSPTGTVLEQVTGLGDPSEIRFDPGND